MSDIIGTYSTRFQEENRKSRMRVLAFTIVGAIVVVAVAIALSINGSALTGGQAVCGLQEHTHTDECYELLPVCGYQEGELVSVETIPDGAGGTDASQATNEAVAHTHTDACYESVLTCTIPEHVHNANCYFQIDADVETQIQWEETIPDDMEGDWADRLVQVAQSQLGYAESEENFVYDADGTTQRGYTRYGDWYGSRYSDWNPLFAQFCLFYSYPGQPYLPYASSVRTWALQVRDAGYYLNADEHEPQVGDVVFLDTQMTKYPDVVAIITAIDDPANPVMEIVDGVEVPRTPMMTVIEGDVDGVVAEKQYSLETASLTDSRIDGYIDMAAMSSLAVTDLNSSSAFATTNSEWNVSDAASMASEAETANINLDGIESAKPYEDNEQTATADNNSEATNVDLDEYEFTKIYEDDELIATAHYNSDANIPENAEFKAAIVDPESDVVAYEEMSEKAKEAMGDTTATMAALLDIGFYIDGVEIEPDAKVAITIQFKDESKFPNSTIMQFVHFGQENTEVAAGTTVQDSTSSFAIESFSPVAVMVVNTSSYEHISTDNSAKLTTAESANTTNLIKVNLYDYDYSVNDRYLMLGNTYPGFNTYPVKIPYEGDAIEGWGVKKEDYEQYMTYSFSDNITADSGAGYVYAYAPYNASRLIKGMGYDSSGSYISAFRPSVTGYGGLINARGTINGQEDIDIITPVLGSIRLNAGADGYPVISENDKSLGYLFGKDIGDGYSVFKAVNGETNINGLFQYNETTGEYSFDSMKNHAQYDSPSNTFTLYNQIITPNYMVYPFGNFLPFNDIVTETQQASTMDKPYYKDLQQRIEALSSNSSYLAKYAASSGITYQRAYEKYYRLGISIRNFWWSMNNKYGNADGSWNAFSGMRDNINRTLSQYSGYVSDTYNWPDLDNIYSVHFDVPKDFFFGMDMSMEFIQPKDGLTGTDKSEDMIYRFAGDNDVWVFIDDVLFLDLTGLHKHVGGAIDFKAGKVYYSQLDPVAGDVINADDLFNRTISQTVTNEEGEVVTESVASMQGASDDLAGDEWYKVDTFAEILTNALTEAGKTPDQISDFLNAHLKTAKDADGNTVYTTFKDYSTHTFKFYYTERGSGSGVCKMYFNMPLLDQNDIMVTKELGTTNENGEFVSVDDEDIDLIGNPDYEFQVLKETYPDSGIYECDTSLIGKEYNVFNSADCLDSNFVGTKTIKDGAIITLKAGETAKISGISEDHGKIKIRELIKDIAADQYDNIVVVNGEVTTTAGFWDAAGNVIQDPTYTSSEDLVTKIVDTDAKDLSDGTPCFVFCNSVDITKFGSLEIEKKLEASDEAVISEDSNKVFDIDVFIDNEPLPAGTEYLITNSEGGVVDNPDSPDHKWYVSEATPGVISIKPGQKAKITGLLAGSTYKVVEHNYDYVVKYNTDGSAISTMKAAEGVIRYSTNSDDTPDDRKRNAVHILVTNIRSDGDVNLPITKNLIGNDGNSVLANADGEFYFTITRVDSNGAVITDAEGNAADSTITSIHLSKNESQSVDEYPFYYLAINPILTGIETDLYYRITENPSKSTITDNSEWYVQIHVKKIDGGKLEVRIVDTWINTIGSVEEPIDPVVFANTLATSLNLSKVVKSSDANVLQNASDEEFTFKLSFTNPDDPEQAALTNSTYNYILTATDGTETRQLEINGDGEATITLQPNQNASIPLPVGVAWTIEEVGYDGFQPMFTANAVKVSSSESQEGLDPQASNASVSGITSNKITSIRCSCTNYTSAPLPSTGSTGLTFSYVLGAAITLGAIALLILNRRRERRSA